MSGVNTKLVKMVKKRNIRKKHTHTQIKKNEPMVKFEMAKIEKLHSHGWDESFEWAEAGQAIGV